ncbi:MAG: LysM domain-containing protein, partial [Nitrospinota bacterium]
GPATASDVRRTSTPPLVHRVKRGETVWSLSRRYGVRVRTLIRLNGLSANGFIRAGDRLTIRP